MQDDPRLVEALRRADAAGNQEDARRIAQAISEARQQAAPTAASAQPQSFSVGGGQEVPTNLGPEIQAGLERNRRFQEVPPVGGLAQAATPLANGATFGYADEATGFLAENVQRVNNAGRSAAGLPINRTAQEVGDFTREQMRNSLEAERANRPIASTATEIAGGFATGAAGAGRAVVARGIGQTAARGSAAGAVGAGAFASGEAEGGIGERAGAAMRAAPVGAAFGGTLPILSRSVGRSFAQKRASKTLTGPQKRAFKHITKALMKDNGQNRGAAEKMLRDWNRTGFDPDWIVQNGGRSVQRLMREVASQEDQRATEMVSRLLSEQPAQIRGEMASRLSSRGRVADISDEIQFVKAAKAAPLYEAAYREVIDPQLYRERLQPLVMSQNGKTAIRKAIRLADAEGDEQVKGLLSGALTDPQVVLDVKSLDYFKRGLDDVIQPAMRSGNKQLAGALNASKRQWLADLDAAAPAYKQARDFWAGETAVQEAMEAGKTFMKRNVTADEIKRTLGRMNESEREFYRVGVVNAMEDFIAGQSDNRNVAHFAGNDLMRQKIRVLMADDPQSADDFIAFLEQASRTNRNAKAILPTSGSQTQLRQVDAAEHASKATRFGQRLANSNPLNAPFDLAGSGLNALGRARDEKKADALAELFFEVRTSIASPLAPPVNVPNAPAGLIGATTNQLELRRQQASPQREP